jgi:hypothetical protein
MSNTNEPRPSKKLRTKYRGFEAKVDVKPVTMTNSERPTRTIDVIMRQ